MKYQFFKLKVKKVRHETKDAISLVFDVPDEIVENYKFMAGQFLTLRIELDGLEHRRAYSITSCPELEEPLSVTIKKTDEGRISNFINSKIKPGDEIDVMTPDGNFTFSPEEKRSAHYFLFAAGSGITPIYSILKTILHHEPLSSIDLVYANSDENSIIFNDELEKLREKFKNILSITHILSNPMAGWDGLQGRLNEQTAEYLIKSKAGSEIDDAQFYICGPGAFMDTVKEALKNLNIDEDNIHFESFTAPLPSDDEPKPDDAKMEIITRDVAVKIYGEEHIIKVEPDETILTTAIAAGLNPPFSCQIGACATCRAKLISGKVHMDARDALSDDDIANGYILTCQSHPLTDDVFVDYD